VARPDRTALCSLALVLVFLPVAGACLLPLALLARRALGAPLWLGYGLWLVSAACYGLRPVQLAMARLLWPIRRPTAAERARLERIWRHVITQAEVSGRRFRIRVVDLTEANAHSVGRDLICVTTGALDQLGDRELAGVLAHELGHHLRMHTSVSAFLVWVLLPLQGIALLGSLLATPVAALANALGTEPHPAGGYGPRRWVCGCARAAFRLGHGIRVVFAAPGVAAFAAKNAAGRSAEYRVDAFAVDIGLGPELLSALRWFAANESTGCGLVGDSHNENEYGRSGRARHAAVRIPRPTHPPLDRRMARIAARVGLCDA
jgi:Zn-dependent protease with chaperone function